jgi:polyvinyl alcohol dehydrogenase (cytochrome)
MDLANGAHRWAMQATANDNWNAGCWPRTLSHTCPERAGLDIDFSNPPVLSVAPDGKRSILLAVQKSGMANALDPGRKGKVLWRRQLPGTVIYGFAIDAERAYLSLSDSRRGAMAALNIRTGEIAWHTPAPPAACAWGEKLCTSMQSSAVTLIPGAAFSGSNDGHIRAYSTTDGSIIWSFDTAAGVHAAVNGAAATGGAVGAASQIVANGTLYVNSGAAFGSRGGNALLAFTVDQD